jgi:hypothetical protein
MKRWLGSLPREQQLIYRAYVLPWPSDPQELSQLCGLRQVLYNQQEKRKADTDALMPFYVDLRSQAHLRYNLLVRIRKAYHQALGEIEQGKRQFPFEFELREGGDAKRGIPARECLRFRIWDRRSFVLAHRKHYKPATVSSYENKSYEKDLSYQPEKENQMFLEFVQAESLNETIPATGLWFLELMEHHVLGQAACLGTKEEIAEKQNWLKAQGYGEDEDKEKLITPFFPRTSGLLIPPQSTGGGEFIKHARAKTGAYFIPVEPFFAAATFGMVALHILTANGMRIGELQQLRASADGIVPLVIPPAPDAENQAPTVHWAVRAVPKGHRTPKTYYFDDEHLRFLSLIKLMLCEHYQIDLKTGGDLPLVALRGNNSHRFPPDHYLFQYNSKSLADDDLRVCIRFLVHGLVFQTLDGRRVSVRPHLLRHGFATWALNVIREPVDIVAAILNQKNVEITKYYGRPNPRLILERSHGLMTQISSSIDMEELILRSPEELRNLLLTAQKTHGTLASVRGGRCLLSGECPIFFACIGCSAKVPDPSQRGEIEEVQQITLIQIERAKKKGLTLEVIQHQKKLKQCQAELREMDMIEACREDENKEPEVNFEIDAEQDSQTAGSYLAQ